MKLNIHIGKTNNVIPCWGNFWTDCNFRYTDTNSYDFLEVLRAELNRYNGKLSIGNGISKRYKCIDFETEEDMINFMLKWG